MQDLAQVVNKEMAEATLASDQAQNQFSQAVEESTRYLRNICKPPETVESTEKWDQLLAKEKEALSSQQEVNDRLRALQVQRINLLREGGTVPLEVLSGTGAQLNQAMAVASQILKGCETAVQDAGGFEAAEATANNARSGPYGDGATT